MLRMYALSRYTLCLISVMALLLMPFERRADAHAYSAGYTTLNLTQSTTEMTYALDQLSVIELIGGDTNKDGLLSQNEFDGIKDQLLALLKENIKLQINNEPHEWTRVQGFGLDLQENAEKAVLKVSYPAISSSATITLKDDLYLKDAGTNYVNLLTVHYGSRTATEALSGQHRMWTMQLTEGADAVSQKGQLSQNSGSGQAEETPSGSSGTSENLSGWLSFFKLGINHILNGYDHLLFLFSLLIAKQSFKQYAAMITAFTVAHSITLTLTVLGIIDVPSGIVEPAIALSICFVAVDNMIRREVSRRWILTFAFGLIHGMGFADILKAMNLPKSQLAAALISFNLGIEAVQVTLIALLLPLLILLHRWKFSRGAVFAGSSIALTLGGIWLAQRLFF
ncbi:Hydrogenase/urease accessory protein HupE [Paenibacillus sophorae]|uniref:HupE/UreJ family protein n=1 Tax=Paenibacillus sophorae TaxID=1333845 RepID=A0A1H8RMV1_9BACL|nr:HupE/UreJ family protein [Paenibacillus sophorae]QWU17062.1 HupE/UreJ family protein [Paenibacillus sophorae]SEO67518.1 Hydrogenase/urease accessory protein HupE [Paenibacillus sophorae]